MIYLSSEPYLPRKKMMLVALTAVLAAVLSVLFIDQNLSLFFKRPELMRVWLFAREITNVGLSIHYFVGSILIYVVSRWWLHHFTQLRAWSRDFFFSLVCSGVLLHVVKVIVGRQRPHISEMADAHVFHPFTLNWDFQSFPSGHAQVMLTVATMMSFGFPKGKWLFFALGIFFAFTRVVTRDHFLSDVIMGGTVGYLGSLLAVYYLHRRIRPELRHRADLESSNGSKKL
jgi:membrane-associated phospholipid phosphatase